MLESQPHQDKATKKLRFWDLLRILLAAALLYVVLSQTSITQIIQTFRGIKLPWLFLYLIIFYLSIWVMAQRYWLLLGKNIPIWDTFKLVSWQTMVGNLLATSAGAVYAVTELKGKHQVKISHGLITIVVARVWDFLSYLIGLCIASLVLWEKIPSFHNLLYLFYPFIVVVFVIMIFFRPFLNWVNRIIRKPSLAQYKIFARLTDLIHQILEYLDHGQTGNHWLLMFYSVLLTSLMVGAVFASYRAFSIEISPWQIMFVVLLQQMVKIIPIQVFGGLGVFDLADLYLYGLFGIPATILAGVIVSKRIIFYLFNLTLLLIFPIRSIISKRAN